MAGADYSLNLAINGSNNAGAALLQVGGFLASLGEQAFTTGVGFNGMASSATAATTAVQVGAADATVAMEEVSVSSHRASGALLAIGAAAVVAGAALVGIGVASVKMAADFQTGLTQLVTDANESKSNLQMVGDGIKQMSIDTATSTDSLVKGMFIVESAGYHGAAGLQVLKAAAQGARLENSDLAQTTDVLTTAMHDYNLSQAQAVPTMNSLIQTVANGKMHLDQLNASLTNVLPVASVLKVRLSDVEGALATMASSGDRGAGAGTHLAMMFKMLSNPAKSAASEMASMGINSIKLAQTMSKSLPAALDMIQKAVAQHFVPGSVQYNRAIAAILGGSKSGIAGLEIMGKNFKDLKTNSDSAAGSMSHAGSAVQGFADVQNTFNFRMDQAKQAFSAMLISIGQQLLPVLTDFAKNLVPIIQNFTQWLMQSGALKIITGFLADALTHFLAIIVGLAIMLSDIVMFFTRNEVAMTALKSVLIAFAIVVAPMVVAALIAMATAAYAAALPIVAMALPFVALGLVIAAFVFGIIELYQHWGAITDWISGKTAQMNVKMQIQDSQAAVKKDQQQKKSAQNTLKNLEKEQTDILTKLKQTNDPITKAELQHQLEMTQNQIDAQKQRIQAADRDAAAQKAKQAQLHADLLEAQKTWNVRFDDMVDTWVGDQVTRFNNWRQHLDSTFNQWASDTLASFGRWRQQFDANFNAWVASSLNALNNWRQQIDANFNSWVAGAVNWGRDLIQNLINGISSMLPNLSSMAQTAANQIASVLHFTHPSKGPLVTVEQWMPHLGDTLVMGLNNIAPQLQAAALRAAASVAGPIKGSADGSMPSHIFDFIGSNYSGYSSGMATTAKREQAADNKAARQAAALAKQEAAVESHIQKLEQHYHIVVNAHGKGKWTKQDATELAKLLAEQTRLQGKHPQTASGRRN